MFFLDPSGSHDDLAKECFSTSVWAREIFIHNHPTYGIARAGVFHDGLSVLYERPDFWKGMVAVYKDLGGRLGIPGTPGTVVGRTLVIGAIKEADLNKLIDLERSEPQSAYL